MVMSDLYDMSQPALNRRGKWDHNSFHPDLILVGLGTNDMASRAPAKQVAAAVRAFIKRLKTLHPDAQILWVFGLMGVGDLSDPIRKAVQAEDDGSGSIRYVVLPNQSMYGCGFGAVGHPNQQSHFRTFELLLPVVKEMLGVGDGSDSETTTKPATVTTTTTRNKVETTTTVKDGTAVDGFTSTTATNSSITVSDINDANTTATHNNEITTTTTATDVSATTSGIGGWLAAGLAAIGLLLAGGTVWLIRSKKQKQ